MYHFQYDHMLMGTMLAALDNNKNCGRQQKKTVAKKSSGLNLTVKCHYRVNWRKPTKKFRARKVYEKKTYGYMLEMMESVRQRASTGKAGRSSSPIKRKIMAPSERPERTELIEKLKKYSRFDK